MTERVSKPSCFKCGASVASFTFIDYPMADKLLMLLFCGKCGAVQGIVAREKQLLDAVKSQLR